MKITRSMLLPLDTSVLHCKVPRRDVVESLSILLKFVVHGNTRLLSSAVLLWRLNPSTNLQRSLWLYRLSPLMLAAAAATRVPVTVLEFESRLMVRPTKSVSVARVLPILFSTLFRRLWTWNNDLFVTENYWHCLHSHYSHLQAKHRKLLLIRTQKKQSLSCSSPFWDWAFHRLRLNYLCTLLFRFRRST